MSRMQALVLLYCWDSGPLYKGPPKQLSGYENSEKHEVSERSYYMVDVGFCACHVFA